MVKKLTLSIGGGENQNFVVISAGVGGGVRTAIKKSGVKRHGILSYAFIAGRILKHMVTKTENIVPNSVLGTIVLAHTRKKQVTRREWKPAKLSNLKKKKFLNAVMNTIQALDCLFQKYTHSTIGFDKCFKFCFKMPKIWEVKTLKTTEELKLIDINELIPYANNARTHSKEQINKIRSSLREFGFVSPVLIDKNKNIIAGHGRVAAAREEKIKKVPCVLVEHLTEAQKKAYIIADNRLALDAGWDEEILALELENLKELDFDVELTGFSAAEIDELFSSIHDKNIEDDDFDIEVALEEKPISKLGDLWLLGRHRLLCGDSTKAETYEKLMDGKKANLVVTDPPYGVFYEGSAGTIQNDSLKDEEFYQFLFKAFKNMENHMANDASIYVFHADTKGFIFRKAFMDAGFYLSGVCQWVKQSLVLGRSPYQWIHEPILFGWKKKGKHKWYAGRSETTVWNFDRPTKSEFHPTMKPVPLVAYPIKNSSLSNSIVLEPFAGSFSTGIACEQLDRICYAIELDEKYTDVCVRRYIEYIGSDEEVFLIRGGEKIKYSDLGKEHEITLA